ncbi:MAG: prepilin-type N-terminal cleavage/methylation domain-containing protein [Candidatus Omnitrophota bacterium]|nr:MAG: prepilin-type N-terminal cleavage/methylation domain-containing protein [Candidatus Omnitrophota bacterium]
MKKGAFTPPFLKSGLVREIRAKAVKRRAGFTLVELMVAVALLVAVLLGLLGVFIGCANLNETSRNLTIAMYGAQEQLEVIRNYDDFDMIANDFFVNGSPNLFDPAGEDDDLDGVLDAGEDDNGNGVLDSPLNGAGAMFISPFGAPPDADIYQVRIVVTWFQKGGRQIGEDTDLDGILDAGEDDNNDGVLSSPAQITTLVTER